VEVGCDDGGVRAPLVSTLVAALAVATGCSGDGDETAPATARGTGTSSTAVAETTRPGQITATSPSVPSGPIVTRPTVPETGVPGLESADDLCRAWSRLGGSFQVIAVAAAFAEGGPSAAAELEVAAAPTVAAAYDDLLASWPAELAAERDVVAEDYLGPFARRAQRAREALLAAGTTDADLGAIAAAWEAALAARDPATPAFSVALDDRLAAFVEAAGEAFAADVRPIAEDPELVVTASTPATDEYIRTNCPDQGTLAGDPGG
jgi:hypothetical protein